MVRLAIRAMDVNALIDAQILLSNNERMKNSAEISVAIAQIGINNELPFEPNRDAAEKRKRTAAKSDVPLIESSFGINSVCILNFGISISAETAQSVQRTKRTFITVGTRAWLKYPKPMS